MCKARAVKTRKAKDVAGNENKLILCNKCFTNYVEWQWLLLVIGPKVVDTTFYLFYSNVVVDNSWVNVSEQSYPILWNPLTNDDIDEINVKYKTVSDEEIGGNMYAKQNEQWVANACPTVMHNLDCPSIDPCQIVNIAPAKGQIPESHKNNQILKHHLSQKNF